MEGFKAAFINEIEKMYKKKKAIVVVIISLVVIVLSQLIVTGMRTGFGIRGVNSSEFPFTVLTVLVYTILPLFTALMAIDVFAGEFSQNSMKIALTRPVTRLKLFSAKIAATAFFVFANLFTVMVLSTLTGFIFNPASFTVSGFVRILVSYVITLIPILTLVLVVVLLANIFRSGSGTFFLCIILFLASIVLGYVFSQYSSLFITSMLNWYKLWIADSFPVLKILRLFLIMAGYGIMAFTAGFYLFDKKDL
jgi:ABC-2 type transport system permease protein